MGRPRTCSFATWFDDAGPARLSAAELRAARGAVGCEGNLTSHSRVARERAEQTSACLTMRR